MKADYAFDLLLAAVLGILLYDLWLRNGGTALPGQSQPTSSTGFNLRSSGQYNNPVTGTSIITTGQSQGQMSNSSLLAGADL